MPKIPIHVRPRALCIALAASASVLLGACATSQVRAPAGVEAWTPIGVSSPLFESHAAFDPSTHDFYFVRSSPAFEGWRILVSHCSASGWSKPQEAVFAGDGVEADPWFTPDGHSLYFISTRSTDAIKRKDLDIWRVDRGPDGRWGTPQRLPEPVNSRGNEWFPRLAKDGWLYFGSDRSGGFGKTDIWRARRDESGRWTVQNAGAAINTVGDEYEPLLSPDDATMIVMADGGLYESHRDHDAWSPRRKLPAQINANGSEIGAAFSPSGNTLLFARDTKGALSGEFYIWHRGASEAWPPRCTAR